MVLKYRCPHCGTPLGYEGLCWRCRAELAREEVLAWSEAEVQEKLANVIMHAAKIADNHEPEREDFWKLLSCRGIVSPALARAALAAEVYQPEALYYQAPPDVQDELIVRLLSAEEPSEASRLMCCLAMQGDEKALEVLLELERHPRPWRQRLYADPSSYAQCGGWTFDGDGERQTLNYDVCYALEKGDPRTDGAVKLGRSRTDRCPHCGGPLVDILVLDGRDERLRFLGIEGIITATCCPNCVCYMEAAYSHFTREGGSEPLASELLLDGVENYLSAADLAALAGHQYVLGKKPVPLFYGAAWDDVSTIGGFANWVQDWIYTTCPQCGRPMRYVAQLQWDALLDGMEGTLYVELCPHCQIVSMQHQQT